jgi:L-ascorbate metabolism protein UlaG (beta-lactamase superfamily)
MDVLRLADKYSDIHFILSKDCKMSPNFLKKHGINPAIKEKITYVTVRAKYEIAGGVHVETLRSTDAGVAFYVETNGATFFHAGDLANWKWVGAGDLTNGVQERNYKFQIRQLKNLPINLAFVPMDPRMGEYQCDGFDYFLKETDADLIFPMHMWQNYEGIALYKRKITNSGMADRVMDISRENQVFLIGEE